MTRITQRGTHPSAGSLPGNFLQKHKHDNAAVFGEAPATVKLNQTHVQYLANAWRVKLLQAKMS